MAASAAVFDALSKAVDTKGAELVSKFNGVVRFKIDDKEWLVDLKNGTGSVKESGDGKADITVTVADGDFVKMAMGKLNPQSAFMSGELKVAGNMGLAMKLGPVLAAAKPSAKL